MQISVPDNYKELSEMADSGLTEPTKVCFTITALAVQCFIEVASDEVQFYKF